MARDNSLCPGPLGKVRKIISQVSLVKKLKKYECQYLFSAEYGTINLLIIANTKHKEHYLVDDGITTIHLYNVLNPDINKDLSIERKLKILRYMFFGLNVRIKKLTNMFTIYDLKPYLNQKIIENKYENLQKKYLNNLEKDQQLYLLGQHLVQRKMLDETTYIKYIKKVIEHYNTTIIYIPHRIETISDEFNKLFNDKFILQPSTAPVEILFLSKNKYPQQIVSFYTSALFNLNKIFPETKIDSVYINPSDLLREDNVINESYKFLENTNINMVSL